MKVKSISSFFPKAGSSSRGASTSRDADEELVEVPSKSKSGGGSKRTKSKGEDRLKVNVGNSEDSDGENPLPKSARTKLDQGGKGNSSKSRNWKHIPDDSDDEDPLPKSARNKKSDKDTSEKKRKSRVLSDSDDDDFKPQKKSSDEKPAAKFAKIEKVEPKKSESRSDREVKKEQGKLSSSKTRSSSKSPEKKKDEKHARGSGRNRSEQSSSIRHSGNRADSDSPHRSSTSLTEPKKLRMGTTSHEKKEKSKPTSSTSRQGSSSESKSKTTPAKEKPTFKAPTPVTKEKSKSKTNPQKRNIVDDDDDEEEDFNPKKKAATSKNKPDQGKPSAKKRDNKTPAKDSDTDGETSKRTITPAQKQSYQKYLSKMSMKPQNLGSKDIPVGAPNCLQGLTFVISGVLDSLERDDCKALVEKYGGRVTGSVSGKTNYLIIGIEPGESKVKKAIQLKVPQIDEDELLNMIRKSNPDGNSQDSGMPFSEDMDAIDSEQFKTEDEEMEKPLFESPVSTKRSGKHSPEKSVKSSEKKTKVEPHQASSRSTKSEHEQTKPVTSAPPQIPPPATRVPTQDELMWVDKYKPKTLKNVVGQGSETSNAKKLLRWLQNWFKYHGSSQDKAKAAWPGLKDPEGKTFKAALLSGPPGVGKTTSAHLVVKELGYDYFELNASDTRNKRSLHQNVAAALSNKTLVHGWTGGDKARKHVLIVDEVDGMSGNEDRGGVQELIGLIKTSRVPVICICNDRNHQKIRSLANYCFDLRFNKPSFEQLKAFILSICFKEKFKLPHEKIQQLIVSTDNDVRQILHQLELFKEGESHQAFNPRKDLRFGPWDVIRKVFHKSEHAKMSIHDRTGLFFQDYNIGPLFVQENYLRWIPAAAGGNRYKHMDLIEKTASSLADGDLVESVIRRNQNWGLLPVQAVFASYLPGEFMSSNQVGGSEFPQWLGKNSNKNKRHRFLQTLHSHLQLHVSGSLEALNMDYLPYLRRTLTNPLIKGDHESAAKIMEDYTLLRDDVESITDLSTWPGMKDPMERVDSKVKAAFTRQVNKEVLPYSNAKPVKGRGRAAANPEDDLEALMEEGEGGPAIEEEEEDDSIEKDAMVKVKTKKAASAKASAAASSSRAKKGKKDDDQGSKNSRGKQHAKSRQRK